MKSNIGESLAAIGAAVIGLAILAVLVSKNAQTPQVLGALGSSFSNVLSAAEAPVTGAVTAANVNGPSSGFGFPSLPNIGTPTLFH